MLLVGILLVVGTGALTVRQFDRVTKVPVAGLTEASGPQNWLLVGTDSRAGIDPDDPNAGAFLGEVVDGNRTDTMMILRLDQEAGTADLLSVPRDLWVPIVGEGRNGRINGAFNGDGGRDRLVATMSDALGVAINQYVEVDFVGFQALVDAIGGVPVWFENPARDVESGLVIAEAGCHILSGSQGLAFARARTFEELIDGSWQLEPTGDLGRTARQRLFLTRVMATAGGRSMISQIGLVDDVLDVVGQNVVVGDAASTRELIGMARSLSSLGADQIVSRSLPVEDFRTDGGAQVLRLQETEAQAVLDLFRSAEGPAAPALVAPSTVDGSNEEPDASTGQAIDEQAAVAVSSDGSAAGYGTFGFVAADSSTGTPCE